MSKRKNFQEKIKSGLLSPSSEPINKDAQQTPIATPAKGPGRPKATHNKVRTTIIINPEYIKQLKQIALDKDLTLTDLYDKAISDLLKKYKK